ncbi:unnamed protein product [Lepeophtheirus salmonis]|uniref:(salmon louse) hypothetical protein n=1 Tax=Lepeophtheirus salmonis TaxID=72036 RepID=A0A7R8H741_LEPSM|nr:unnamed protein product [Lepeophtheirus salmonis]CAF2900997.1 unnamed protein product [Lepeophtheirus salmonis]
MDRRTELEWRERKVRRKKAKKEGTLCSSICTAVDQVAEINNGAMKNSPYESMEHPENEENLSHLPREWRCLAEEDEG